MEITRNAALVVVDVQKGFEEAEFWGPRDNPAADRNIAALIGAWQDSCRSVVFVRHDSPKADSPLRPRYLGNDFKEYVEERRGKGSGPELLVTKTVNSAFYGTPDLDAWFKGERHHPIRAGRHPDQRVWRPPPAWAANLGHDVLVALDATHTFDLTGPNGWRLTAAELARATAVSLHGGGFARVVTTDELVTAARP